ncbi:MAG: hypothetical protein M3527_01620 [Actinomycetota bacterium]|nr:hypothetical protein [Acidimicrobiia bacterium]MDQ3293140.1 hypothetical protein [Actinomycetota bacterium]
MACSIAVNAELRPILARRREIADRLNKLNRQVERETRPVIPRRVSPTSVSHLQGVVPS